VKPSRAVARDPRHCRRKRLAPAVARFALEEARHGARGRARRFSGRATSLAGNAQILAVRAAAVISSPLRSRPPRFPLLNDRLWRSRQALRRIAGSYPVRNSAKGVLVLPDGPTPVPVAVRYVIWPPKHRPRRTALELRRQQGERTGKTPSYGIHGTPAPEDISKTQSHGCIRLTNWDAVDLATMARPGTSVRFDDKDSPVAPLSSPVGEREQSELGRRPP
jgi:hypothetical protein